MKPPPHLLIKQEHHLTAGAPPQHFIFADEHLRPLPQNPHEQLVKTIQIPAAPAELAPLQHPSPQMSPDQSEQPASYPHPPPTAARQRAAGGSSGSMQPSGRTVLGIFFGAKIKIGLFFQGMCEPSLSKHRHTKKVLLGALENRRMCVNQVFFFSSPPQNKDKKSWEPLLAWLGID